MDAKVIQKYKNKTTAELMKLAQTHFNKFVRLRDRERTCISCGARTELQAGHYYSAGKYQAMRFLEINVHGQCMPCNYYKSGNLLEYRLGLIKRYGKAFVENLDCIAQATKANYHVDRFALIDIIELYKQKNKQWK